MAETARRPHPIFTTVDLNPTQENVSKTCMGGMWPACSGGRWMSRCALAPTIPGSAWQGTADNTRIKGISFEPGNRGNLFWRNGEA
jgi:hypothetical protein